MNINLIKQLALLEFLQQEFYEKDGVYYTKEDNKEIEEYEESNSDYLVYTNKEADEAFEEYLDNYIEDCIMPELPKQYRYYFDSESFKNDCRTEGRGLSIATYNGVENEVFIERDNQEYYFYIYKIN